MPLNPLGRIPDAFGSPCCLPRVVASDIFQVFSEYNFQFRPGILHGIFSDRLFFCRFIFHEMFLSLLTVKKKRFIYLFGTLKK